MATTSTIPAVKAALVSALAAALPSVHVVYQWDGAAARPEMIFLDSFGNPESPVSQSARSEIPTLKAGRKAREESYTITVTIWVVQTGGKASTAAATEARGFVLLAALEDVLANDPGLGGVAGTTGRFALGDYTRRLAPAERGWTSVIDAQVDCKARLS